MTTREYEALWPEIVAIRPEKVVITGGEPMLRPDLEGLLHGFHRADDGRRIRLCINTNGHLLNEARARMLVGLVDEVRVSLDGVRAVNDRLRGAGNFEAVLSAMRVFRLVGFEPKVLVTVTSESLARLEELLHFLIDLDIGKIKLNPFRMVGRGRGHLVWRVTQQQIDEVVGRVMSSYGFGSAPLNTPPGGCNCGIGTFVNILPNGDVYPCHVLASESHYCGNVREGNLRELCGAQGFLGRLRALDFGLLARQRPELAPITEPGACFGDVLPLTTPDWLSQGRSNRPKGVGLP